MTSYKISKECEYEYYEYEGKYLLIDHFRVGTDDSECFDTLDEILELIDERFVFTEVNDGDSEFFENWEMSKDDWENYLSKSLRDRLLKYSNFSLCKWNPKTKTYIEDDVLGSRTYPNGRHAKIKWQPDKFPYQLNFGLNLIGGE
tara:strand:- start:514 stop:948 length:435 start_codon:yes stop_codon:yes gene_type:complete